MDANNQILQDQLSEYDENGEEIGFSDYRRIKGELKLIARTEDYWIEKDKIARCDWYNAENQLVYYDIFKFDQTIAEMCWDACYNPLGNTVSFLNVHLGKYSDYYIDLLNNKIK